MSSVECPPSFPLLEDTSCIPAESTDYNNVFNKPKAFKLPPHLSSNYGIDLVKDALLAKSCVFSLSRPEEEVMAEYVTGVLTQGVIHLCMVSISSGFFFIKKADARLQLCIGYRVLNDIKVKRREPLFLIPSTLEQLCTTCIFTKLNLQSAYNLIRIYKGDKWKTSFIMNTGQYEYHVMPYGLASSPAISHFFMNEVLACLVNHCGTIYIDNILLYSTSLAEHLHNITCSLYYHLHT